MTKAEEDFIEQYARVLLVSWCVQTLEVGHITGNDVDGIATPPKIGGLCLEHALEKGWVGKSEPKKVLSKGFSTAASFLKR